MLHACCAAERIDYSTCHIENERARCVSRVVFLLLLPFPDALHAESAALFFVHSRYVCRVSEYNYRNYLLPVMFLSHFSCTYSMVINYGILYSLSNLAALDKISHTKIKKKIIFDNRFSIYYNQLHLTCTYKTRERGRERRNFFLVVASVLEYLSLPREKTCDEHNTFSIFSDFSFSTQFSLFVAFTQFTSDVYALVQCG